MPFDNRTIAGLRQAVRLSPENLPLRQALADALMGIGRYEDAEAEYRQALSLSPEDAALKTLLAKSFFSQGKTSHAMVVVEQLLKMSDPPPPAVLLHARLLLRGGQIDSVVRQYRRAIDADPALVDDELAAQLGIVAWKLTAPARRSRVNRCA